MEAKEVYLMSSCQINRGQSKSMILIDITNDNLISYKQFENYFDKLSFYLSRIYPDFDTKIKWCYINVEISNIKAFNVYQNIGFKESKRFTKSNGVDVIQMKYIL